MVWSSIINDSLEVDISDINASQLRLNLSEYPVPMTLLQVLAAKSSDQFAVVAHLVDLISELVKHFILFALLELHLGLHVLGLVVVDLLDNGFSVLVLEGLQVPGLLVLLEGVSVGPQSVALLKPCLEDLYLSNHRLVELKDLLILLEVLNLLVVDLKALSDLLEFLKSLGWLDLWLGQNLVVKSFNLLNNVSLLLLNF